MWDEQTEEAENDMAGLCLSFLSVQAIRYSLVGVLPDREGHERPQHQHNMRCIAILGGVGLLFAFLTLLSMILAKRGTRGEASFLQRIFTVCEHIFAMSFAWCLLYTVKWSVVHVTPDALDPNGVMTRVVLALTVSFLCFALIFFLDKIEDLDCTGASVDRAIEHIIFAIGILVGFSWEQGFETSVEVMAELTPRPIELKAVLAGVVAVTVIPAWSMYILKTVIELEKENEERHDSHKKLPSASDSRRATFRQKKVDGSMVTMRSFRRSVTGRRLDAD